MPDKLSNTVHLRIARGFEFPNAYTVYVTNEFGDTQTLGVYTNADGDGLWIDHKQILGTGQFHAGKNAAAAYRHFFTWSYNVQPPRR